MALTDTEVKIGDTQFLIRKLLPESQFEVWEMIRPHLGAMLEKVSGDAGETVMSFIGVLQGHQNNGAIDATTLLGELPDGALSGLLKSAGGIISGLPPAALKQVQAALFEHVLFQNRMQPQPRKLAGALNTAFKDQGFYQIYEMTVRAFAVNFGASWSGVASLAGTAGDQDSSQPSTET